MTGSAFHVLANILTELFYRHIAAHRILAQCHQNDPVEIAAQTLNEAFARLSGPDASHAVLAGLENGDAGAIRLIFANGLHHFRQSFFGRLERAMAG